MKKLFFIGVLLVCVSSIKSLAQCFPPTTITYSPTDTNPTYCKNAVSSLSAAVTGGSPFIYQWYSFSGSQSWDALPPQSPIPFTYTPQATGTYKVEVRTLCNVLVGSQTWTVTVNPSITVQPLAWQQACPNVALTPLTVTVPNATSYQWYNGTPGSGTLINGATTSSYTPPNTSTGSYYVVATSSCGGSVTSSPAIVWVQQPTLTIINPSIQVTCLNSNSGASLSVIGWDQHQSLQWYRNTTNSNTGGTRISGAKTAPYYPSLLGTYYYYAEDSSCAGIVKSNVSLPITVNPNNTTSPPSSSPTLCQYATLSDIIINTTGATGISSNGVSGANGLPKGVIAYFSGNTITIYGSPAEFGTFNYSIPLTGGCGSVNATGTITVLQAPSSVSINDQYICNGSQTSTVNFGTAASYNWTNNTPSIGLSESGTGNIPAFTPINSGSTDVVATVTVTPISQTCTGTSSSFQYIVKRLPTVNTVANQTKCNGGYTDAVNFIGTGSAYLWTNDNSLIGVPASGSGNIGQYIVSNSGITAATATIIVTPYYYGGCTGPAKLFTITVNPTPSVNSVTNQTVCNGAPTSVNFGGVATSYNWTNNNTSIGLPASGSGNIAFAATNSGSIPVTATITVTPVYGTCSGSPKTFSITVTPTNTAGAPSSSPTLCINTALTNITITTSGATGIGTPTGLPSGVTASWATNTITISGTPTAAGTFNYSIPLTGGCGNVNATGTITVTPANTTGAPSSSPTLCINTALSNITITTSGATGIGTPTGLPSGVTASWATNTITISGTPTAAGTFNYSIPLTGGCGSVNANGTITVNSQPSVSITPLSPSICPGSSTTLTASGASSYSWSTGATTASITVSPSSTTTYSVTGTTNSCSATVSSTVTVKSAYGYITTSSSTICGNTYYTFTAGPGTNYHWSTGATTSSIQVSAGGTYSVTYITNGCTVTASTSVGIGEVSADPSNKDDLNRQTSTERIECPAASSTVDVKDIPFTYYPNPAKGEITIVLSKTAKENCPVLWYSMSGQEVRSDIIESGNKQKTFPLNGIDAGLYLVRIKDNEKYRYSKIVVE